MGIMEPLLLNLIYRCGVPGVACLITEDASRNSTLYSCPQFLTSFKTVDQSISGASLSFVKSSEKVSAADLSGLIILSPSASIYFFNPGQLIGIFFAFSSEQYSLLLTQ